MALPINFTNHLNNRGSSHRPLLIWIHHFFPTIYYLKLKKKNFSQTYILPLATALSLSSPSRQSALSLFPFTPQCAAMGFCTHHSSGPDQVFFSPADCKTSFCDTMLLFFVPLPMLFISIFLFDAWSSSFILSLKYRCYPRDSPGLLLFLLYIPIPGNLMHSHDFSYYP